MVDFQYVGHVQKIRQKLMKSQLGEIENSELLEILLCYAHPRLDMRDTAKTLLSHYHTLNNIISTDNKMLEKIPGIDSSTVTLLRVIKEFLVRSSKDQIMNKPVISSWKSLIDYLRISMAYSNVEMFRVLYLNKKNVILNDQLLRKGTIDHVTIYPREIVKQALLDDASAIIMVHNHPSGVAKPSAGDIKATKEVMMALKTVNIILHDHVIVSNKEYFSFRAKRFLE